MLVPMGDARALAGAIDWTLSHPAEANRMGLAGRERVRANFTITHTAAKVQVLYDYMMRRFAGKDPLSVMLMPKTALSISDGVARHMIGGRA
jgi:hypothetical protein